MMARATVGLAPTVALAVALTACTTITAPKAPRPGLRPLVFGLDQQQAIAGLRSTFGEFEDVRDLQATERGIEFHYHGFVGRVMLLCLAGRSASGTRSGWWPAVSLEGRSTWLWPWATARVLTFYGSMPEVSRRALRRAGAERWRISNPEIADPAECEAGR